MVANTLEADTTRQLGKLKQNSFRSITSAGNGQYQMGSSPYVQFKPDNVTTVKGIVKVTTMYRSFVLVRVG